MPPATIIPELAYSDVGAAVAWLCDAFGFKERVRIANHRCQLTFGEGGCIVVVEGSAPVSVAGCSVMVRVDDAQSHHEHARQHGARILQPPTDYPYGERQYTAVDPGGRCWTFSQSIADIDPAQWGGKLIG